MKAAFLFPGQGAKNVAVTLRALDGDGAALAEHAAVQAGVSLSRIARRPLLLDRTEVLQPVLTALALAASLRLSRAGIEPSIVVGQSLGEVAAWSAAGGISAERAVELCALRGRLMAREAAKRPGGMVALASGDPGLIEGALAAGRRAGALYIAAHNAPEETVLSGDEAALRAAMAHARGVATRIATAGAWHSPAMAGALAEWRAALRAAPRSPLRCAFIANRHGDVVTSSDAIPDLLAEQLVRQVELARSFVALRAHADALVTVGPGAVLRSLVRKNFLPRRDASRPDEAHPERDHAESHAAMALHHYKLLSTDDERSLTETIAALRGAA